MNFLEQQKRYAALVDEALSTYLPAAEDIPKQLIKSMSYSVFAGGKRLRPAMTLAVCEMLNGSAEDAMPFACALEMIHTYSLIHDDLPAMDNDDYRRGKPTNHKVFGEGQAVLAGDALLSYAFEIMLKEIVKRPELKFALAAQAVARGAGITGMVAGQSLDLQNEGGGRMDEDTLLSIHRGKTSAMLLAAVEAGAHCAGAGEETLAHLREFGAHYGLLFQITDDILDITGDEGSMGKTLGKDEKAGKLTFPAVYGLDGAIMKAEEAAAAAHAALRTLGGRAWYLSGLISYTLTRRS
ncbi:MAG TPA: farnesyl diphosphate synthase [Feifaniaceae bacterium]|nr:farnesyl diphosphate synthase [Feifaniaceae bacterium]